MTHNTGYALPSDSNPADPTSQQISLKITPRMRKPSINNTRQSMLPAICRVQYQYTAFVTAYSPQFMGSSQLDPASIDRRQSDHAHNPLRCQSLQPTAHPTIRHAFDLPAPPEIDRQPHPDQARLQPKPRDSDSAPAAYPAINPDNIPAPNPARDRKSLSPPASD